MLNLRGSPHFHRIIVCIPIARKSLVCVCNHRVCFNRRAYEGPYMANLQCETLVLFLFPRLWKALLESTAKAVVTVSSGKAKRGDCDTRGSACTAVVRKWEALDSIFQLVLH